MGYMDVFLDYVNSKISASTADFKLEKLMPDLLVSGEIKEHAKASLCRTYFKRYQQYNIGEINSKDLVLFVRDFVLFLGRFRLPRLITDVVDRYGEEFGLFIASDGAVDATENYPKKLVDNKNFIQEIYSLGKDGKEILPGSAGDYYIHRYTPFYTYRSLEQKIAVHSAIELPDNYTIMISLPTGGGKSLITQLLAATENKLTLVIVPTVSLAKDQYLQAVSCICDEDIRKNVFCYRGDSDNDVIITSIKSESARLIFTSPEAILKSMRFNKALRDSSDKGYLHNVVLDEAHIVTDWGVHFRPDFQIFAVVLKELRELSGKKIRTYLLSATLSEDVVDVLFGLFGSEGNNVQYRCDALRQEPRYIITESHNYEGRESEVIEMVKLLPKPLIVYVIEPATAKRYCKKLKEFGFSNIYSYTGDTSDTDREILLEKWKANDFDVMIATSAFGMGVDKSNVRTIIHSCVPENLSRFYQEVGRAGRDGLPSLSVMSFYSAKNDNRNDLTVAFGLVNKSILKKENILIRLDSILRDNNTIIDGDMVIADLNTVPNSFTDDEAEHAGMRNMCWNANTLLLLHRQGYIEIQKANYDVNQKTYFFTFKMKDVDLINDKHRLGEMITDDRQREYDMRVAGYHKMANLVRRPKVKCWGKHFVSLYPLAQPICKGCPVHPEGTYVKDDEIRIRDKSIVSIESDEPSQLLKRYMGPLDNLLIPVEDYESLDIHLIVQKANKLNIACFVVPDNITLPEMTGCMYLKHSEFLVVADKVPWVLRNGLLVLFNDDNNMSNKLFEAANTGVVEKYRKVWCCKVDTRIISRNRTIHEFLNCRTCNLVSL